MKIFCLLAILCSLLTAQTTPDNVIVRMARGDLPGLQAQSVKAFSDVGKRLEKSLHIHLMETPIIWLCHDQDEMEKATSMEIWNLAIGIAIPKEYTIAIDLKKISFPDNSLDAVIRHETVHLYLGSWQEQHKKNIPLWFNEGMAEYFSNTMHIGYQERIFDSLIWDKIIPFSTLKYRFPQDANLAMQAYLQSLSMIKYLVTTYDENILRTILQRFEHAPDFDTAMVLATGKDVKTLQQEWYVNIHPGNWWLYLWQLNQVLSLFAVLAIMAIIAFWRQRRRRHALFIAWQEQEFAQNKTIPLSSLQTMLPSPPICIPTFDNDIGLTSIQNPNIIGNLDNTCVENPPDNVHRDNIIYLDQIRTKQPPR